MFAAGKGSGYATRDTQFPYTSLLVHADGTNGTNNKTFLDSSTNNITITASGAPFQGTFSPYSQTGWSVAFGGTSDYVTVTNTAALQAITTGDFHMEAWIFLFATGGNYSIFSKGINNSNGFNWYIDSSNNGMAFTEGGTANNVGGYFTQLNGGYFNQNTAVYKWNHVMVGRVNSKLYFGINGEIVQYAGTDTYNLTSSSNAFIGAGRDAGSGTPATGLYFNGQISNLRVIYGTNPYGITASTTGLNAYTVPTTALTAVSGTVLLACQSGSYTDNSSNALTLRENNSYGVRPIHPFAPSDKYKSALAGGSLDFNNLSDTNNYISGTLSTAFGTGDFTVEGWFYPRNTGSNLPLMSFGDINTSGTFGIIMTSDSGASNSISVLFEAGPNYVVIGSYANIPQYAWTHVAVVRQSGAVKLYFNGQAQGNGGTFTNNITATTFYVGYSGPTLTSYFKGCISDFRVVAGTAIYTSNFTPPTAPLSAVANTKLLLKGTNSNIIDQTARHNLNTTGSAAISTTRSKYGTGSMVFNGSTDYIFTDYGQLNALGINDFTVEFWIYCNSVTTNQRPLSQGTYAAGQFLLIMNTDGSMSWCQSTTARVDSAVGAFTTGVWTHVAVVRSGGNTRMFKDGVVTGNAYGESYPYYNYSSFASTYIGGNPTTSGQYFNGYIDDLRITRGYARYNISGSFTPPTSPFADQ